MENDTTILLRKFFSQLAKVEKKLDINLKSEDYERLLKKEYLTIDECASFTGIKKSQLYKLTSQNKIPHFKLGKSLRFNVQEILYWIKSHNE